MAFDIYAQADVVTARLSLAPRSSAGTIETTLMRAIRAGANTPHDLTDIFGLAPRLVLQVVGDLWRAGRVSVELQAVHETLSLTTSGMQELETVASTGPVKTTATTTTTEDLVIERLTGRALPTSASVRRVPYEDRDLMVPATAEDRAVASVTQAELVAALAATIAGGRGTEVDEMAGQRVHSAFLQPDKLQVAKARRYVKLRAAAQLSSTDELTVVVLDPRLTLSERARATRRLQAIVDSQPQSHFAQRLRARAVRSALQTRDIDQVLSELHRHVAALASCSYAERQQRHDKAGDLATQVAAYAQSRTTHEMDVEVISTSEEHAEVITRLFDRAQRQVVIAVPWIRAKGLEPLRVPLLSALGRGVQVVLVWGIEGHLEGLHGPESAWLDSITAHVNRTGVPGKLVYSRSRAARSHAKLVISDDRQMLVTSKNFLSRSNHTEAGVLLSAVDNQHSPAIEAALSYVYDKAPEPRIAFSLHRLPGAFGPRDPAPELPLRLPRLHPMILNEDAPPESVDAWAAAWADAAGRVQRLLSRPLPTVDPVSDLAHRGVLRDAVGAASTRVIIASDKMTETALSQDAAEQIIGRAAEGIAVTLRYRESPIDGHAGLHDILAADEPAIDLARDPSMHAKVVVRDDQSLIGSFNPLSVDANLRKRRSTGEFGVIVQSGVVADAIYAVVAGKPAPPRAAEPITEMVTELGAADRAQSLLEAALDQSADSLLALVAEHGLSALLDAYNGYGVHSVDELRLAGAALAAALDTATDPTPAAMLAVKNLMRTGNWGVADLLRPLIPDRSHRPRPLFTSALSDGTPAGQALFTALTSPEEADTRELDALIVADSVQLLLNDYPQASGDSELFLTSATPSPRVGKFFEAASAYLRRYGALAEVAPVREAEVEVALPALWSTAEEVCASFAQYDTHSGSGNRLMKHLISPDGELGALGAALQTRDASAVASWRDDYLQTPDDGRWLDRIARTYGIPRITDSRRRSLMSHRRKVRIAVTELCAEFERLEAAQRVSWVPDQLTSLDVLLEQTKRLVSEVDHATPEGAVEAAELGRILSWAAGTISVAPLRHWNGWAFVHAYLAAVATNSSDVPLAAIARDLAAVRTGRDAVDELARAGEYEHAGWVIERVSTDGTAQRDELRSVVTRHRGEAQDSIDERVRTLVLTCHRADVPAPGTAPVVVGLRRRDAESRVAALYATAEAAIDARRAEVAHRLATASGLTPGWTDYVGSLIRSGELALAERALTHVDGFQELPHPKPFARWSWRDSSAREITAWFADESSAPAGVSSRFAPNPDDQAGRAVIEALSALSEDLPDAPQRWVDSVQQLLSPDDDYHRPRFTFADDRITATFRFPWDQRLPLLRWARADAVTVAVGSVPAPEALVRFPLATTMAASSETLVEIHDVLSLLARTDTDRTPTPTDRALQFLAVVCSRLELSEIIEPRDMPAGESESARRRLAWLLSILGLTADARDVDRLSVWSGGHHGVLWTLVQQARMDPTRSAGSVIELPELDALMLRGIETDLEHDEDLLVLGLGLAGGHLVDGCSEAELAALLEDEWHQGGRSPEHRIRVSEVVRRLKDHGYISERSGLLYSCGCLASRAVERIASEAWLAERMDLVDPERLMLERAYEFILDMVRHQQQAEETRLSDAEMEDQARQGLSGRLSDTSAFDLVELCDTVRREYSRGDVDVLCKLADERLWVQDAGPSIWIESLGFELLNNAIAATSDLPPGEATVRLTVERDPQDDRFAILSVRNNGRRVPTETQEAFRAGRRVHDPVRPKRGTGLYRFKTFGETRGVVIVLDETEHQETVVRCRIPLADPARPSLSQGGTSAGTPPA